MEYKNIAVNETLTDKNQIEDFLLSTNLEMYKYVSEEEPQSKYVLCYKCLTHSDLPTFGKATQIGKYEDNFLYYLTTNDIKNIEESTKKIFQTAHQSNICLNEHFYKETNLPYGRQENRYYVNDFFNVLLVNSSLEYFNSEYTQKIFNKLGKNISTGKKRSWNFSKLDVNSSKSRFTPIDLHSAAHGFGTQEDQEFHKLRHHLFKSDTIIFLAEIKSNSNTKNNLFILVEKNPIFFTTLNICNKSYQKYLEEIQNKRNIKTANNNKAIDLNDSLTKEDNITRAKQGAWRNLLATEMMAFTAQDDKIFCPFTYIEADFQNLSPLFIASHIKAFSDKNTSNEEKYDINNGLLLSANADALFNSHLISINENKELVFSFLLENDTLLKQKLLLMQPIFTPILNSKRMEYLKYHKKVFDQKEQERKTR